MSLIRVIAVGLAVVTLTCPALADDDPFTPSNEQLDQDLDRALAEEFAEPEPPPPRIVYVEAPPAPSTDDDGRRRRDRVRLGLMGAYWHAQLYNVEVEYFNGQGQSSVITFADPDDDPDDDDDYSEVDGVGAATFSAWIDLGRFVRLEGGFRKAMFEDEHVAGLDGAPSTFSFGNLDLNPGQRFESAFTVMTADFNLVFKPLDNEFICLDVSLGARYMFWETELSTPYDLDSSRIEAVIPTIGVGLEVRPVPMLAWFCKARYGTLEYDVEEHWEYDDWDDEWDYYEYNRRSSSSLEVDVGMSLTIEETIGFVVGYRLDYIEMEHEVDNKKERLEGTVHGLYGGLILSF